MSQKRSVSPSERIYQNEPMSPRQSVPTIPAIVEVDSPFENEQDKVVITYTFDVVENQVILNTEDEGCCGKFMHDGTRTLRDITINNVNILTLDIDKVNLLRDSYKLCLQKVRKITSILDLVDISSKLMSAASKGLMAVLPQIH
ncbi:MAG: hypothetical protein EZS28_039182 [Streblomastix strix]|uniref:Uncharacterized protein n=1 Tax=Streblomastix strix TaxID=222440 RepID=A0A5J4U5U2_9EUKA|nr:MAG: hypothetical protein EZS28_039182 [Streblomastix strix]